MMSAKAKSREERIFVIDAGTQSIRETFVNLHSTICDFVKKPIAPFFSFYPGRAGQDPEYYRKIICRIHIKPPRKDSFDSRAIKNVTSTTQQATVISTGKNGKTLHQFKKHRCKNNASQRGV